MKTRFYGRLGATPLVGAVLLVGIALLDPPRAESAVPAFDKIYVFGDSLSDTGNLDREGIIGFLLDLFVDLGPTGSFSDGIVWNEYLADDLGLTRPAPSYNGGTNYAYGGARTDSTGSADDLLGPTGMAAQVDEFIGDLGGGSADPDALYIVWGGGNDMRDATSTSQAAPAVANLEQHVRDLVGLGAQYVLMPNLPNLGRTPESIAAGQSAVELAQSISLAFNDELSQAIDGLDDELSIDIFELDVFTFMEALAGDGQAFGFTNVTVPCGDVDGPCIGDLFWDEIHPTTAAHALLGHTALASLAGSPIGDMNGDGTINSADGAAMVLALIDRDAYATQYPMVDADVAGDVDYSGTFDLGDLRPFQAMLGPTAATALASTGNVVPEPSALVLVATAGLLLAARRQNQISQNWPQAPT